MNDRPTVTIAIPTINRSKYLAEAIESCLSQTYQDFEIVISDNKSDDDTEQMVRSFNDPRIKFFKQNQRVSPVANWNRCVELATGEFITFLCDDDLLEAQYLEKLLGLLSANPNAELARCACRFIDADGTPLGTSMSDDPPAVETPEDLLLATLRGHRILGLDGSMCRTRVLSKVGGIVDIGFPGGFYSDHYTWFQVAYEGKVAVGTSQILWRYRRHSSNADVGIDLAQLLSNVPNYIRQLSNLASRYQCHPETVQLVENEWGKNIIYNWLIRDMRNWRAKSTWRYIKRLPYYYQLAGKYGIPVRRRLMGIISSGVL